MTMNLLQTYKHLQSETGKFVIITKPREVITELVMKV